MSSTPGSATMIFHILVTIFFFGFALLIGILSIMRGIYSFSTCQPPPIASDSAAKVSLDEDHGQAQLSWSTGGRSRPPETLTRAPKIRRTTAPIEVDGVVYFSPGVSEIRAVDVKSGKECAMSPDTHLGSHERVSVERPFLAIITLPRVCV
jgi:hypothetical protein